MNILLAFYLPHVNPNQYGFSSVEHNRRILNDCAGYFFLSIYNTLYFYGPL